MKCHAMRDLSDEVSAARVEKHSHAEDIERLRVVGFADGAVCLSLESEENDEQVEVRALQVGEC